jgi:predicted lysophospholipase L1 biosynthesis ABC-type transport system permease subunit
MFMDRIGAHLAHRSSGMWMLFVGELRRRWVEVALGATAVALVVAALVTERALTASAESAVHELAHRLGRNMLVVSSRLDLAAFHEQRYGREGLPESAPATLGASEIAQHLRSAEARLYGNLSFPTGEVVVVGQDLGWPAKGDLEPAVVGPTAARILGVQEGSFLPLGNEVFSVLQVADPPPDGLDAAVFLPLSAAQRVLRRPGEITALRLGGCWCRVDVATLASQVEDLLPGSRAITVAGMIQAQKGAVSAMKRYSGVLHVAGLAVVALVIAALVVSQTRRRIREIGLLAAIGAPPAALARIITAQAALTGLAGGLAGWVVAGPLLDRLGAATLGASVALPGELLLPAVILPVAVSALAAAIPAFRATNLDPTAVLREI